MPSVTSQEMFDPMQSRSSPLRRAGLVTNWMWGNLIYSKFHRVCLRVTLSVVAVLIVVIPVWGQPTGQPSNSLCKQWDDAYLSFYTWVLWSSVVGIVVVSVVLPVLLGKKSWLLTAPRLRVFVIGGAVALISVTVCILVPLLLGYTWPVDGRYPLCSGKQFGADGPFFGLVNANIAAYDQPIPLGILLVSAAIFASLIACTLGEIALRNRGLFANIKEVES